MTAALQNYHARMQRVLDHISQHLDNELDLEAVSGIAAFSKYHFHRQFASTFGLSVHRYVQLARMERASRVLADRNAQGITEIAWDAGYGSPDAFARAFRQRFGQSPSSFRKSPDWGPWLAAFGPLDNARNTFMQIIFDHDDVKIQEFSSTPVAIIEHRGDRAMLGNTIQRFRAWREAAGLSPETSPTFMVFRSEREPADLHRYSVDLCAGTERSVELGEGQMKAGVIPGGRCAVMRYPGNTNNLEAAAQYLYRDWLPASGEEARDFPMYSRRYLSSVPGMPAPEVVLELILPLR